MSEYWVSKKKYFCKYCDIYIADDAPSRQQHENGLRHKGNLDRFIRGLYKSGEKRKKDQDEEKRELSRLEQVAQAAFAQDVAAGHARPGAGPVASTSAAPKKPTPKPSNPYANYSSAASLGYTDPDVERLAAETERRRTQGVVGEWEVVNTITPTLATASDHEDEAQEVKPNAGDENVSIGTKREAEVPVDGEDARSFKLRKKGWGAGLSGGYDFDSIPIKLKMKEEEVQDSAASATVQTSLTLSTSGENPSTPSGAPKWTKVKWKKAGDPVADADTHESRPEPALEPAPAAAELELHAASNSGDPTTTKKAKLQTDETSSSQFVKSESEENLQAPSIVPSSTFRKRKVPARATINRR